MVYIVGVAPASEEGAASASEEKAQWMTDFEAAKAKAAAEQKPVLLNFTGSDWCPPCKYLHQNVFATDAFASYAKEELILVELDFPRRKVLPAEQQKQNAQLARAFNIGGYPTVILLDSDGETVLDKTVGVAHRDVTSFIRHTESIVAKR